MNNLSVVAPVVGDSFYCPAYFNPPLLANDQTCEPDGPDPPSTAPLVVFNDDDGDSYTLAAAPFVVSGIFSSAGQEIGSRVASSLMDRFAEYFKIKFKRAINAVFPEPLTPEEKQAFEILYSSESFSSGVSEILKQTVGLEPHQAISVSFKFLYRHKPKHPLAKVNPHPYGVTTEDIKALMDRYDLNALQIYNIASLVHDSFGWEKEHIWHEIANSIITANLEKKTGQKQPEQIVDRWTDTQEVFLKGLQSERLKLELSAFKNILKAITEEIERTPSKNGQIENVTLWDQFQINIGPKVVGKSLGRMALVEKLEGLITAIDRGRPLATEEEAFLSRLKDNNAPLQKIIESKTHFTKAAINGTNLALDMLKDVKNGRNLWFTRVLMEVAGSSEPVTTGVILLDNGGKELARYEFGYNTTCPVTGKYISLYKEGDPHPFGPFSFKKGHILVIKGNLSSVEHAIQITSGNQRSFFITLSDIERLKIREREASDTPSVRNSSQGRAFLRFYNRVQAVFKMIFGDEFQLKATTEKEAKRARSIEKMAERLGKENWIAELEQEIDRFARRFASPVPEEAELSVRAVMRKIRSAFMPYFSQRTREDFGSILTKFVNSIITGDVAGKNTAILELKQLVAKHFGGPRISDQLSIDLYGEFTIYKDAVSLEAMMKDKNASPEVRAFVVARGVGDDLPPSLERAKRFRVEGSIDKALLEYERVAQERSLPQEVQMQAMSEAALLAAQNLQFPRAKRFVTRLRLLEARGIALSEDAKMVIGVVEMIPSNGGPGMPPGSTADASGEVFVVRKGAPQKKVIRDPYIAQVASDAKTGNKKAIKELQRLASEGDRNFEEAVKVLELGETTAEELKITMQEDMDRPPSGWRFWERFGRRGSRGRGGKKGMDKDVSKRARMF